MSAILSSDPYGPSPEQLLALALLSQHPVSDAAVLVAQVQRADWKRLLSLTTMSLHPFLHFVLKESGMLCLIPAEALGVLERAKADAVIRYMRRRTELQKVFMLFNDHGIEAAVLKGASLAESVYPTPYLRVMRDVDLWIPEAQMRRACSLLEANGYREKHVRGLENCPRDGKEARLAKFFTYDLSIIELHSTLDIHLPADTHETNAIWNRLIEQPGLRVKTLHPQDMLRHLCMHLAMRHRFEQGLLWLLDIRLFLARYGLELEWDALAEQSRHQQTSKYLYISLEMVADLLGCAVAKAAFGKFDPPNDVPRVKSLAWRQIWNSEVGVLPPRKLMRLATAGSTRKMFQFLIHRLYKYLSGNSPDDQKPEGLLQRVWSSWQWVVGDLRKTYSAFRSGAFSRANLQKAYEIEVRRTEFEERMQI